MYDLVKNYIIDYILKKKKRSFQLDDLEGYLVEKYGGQTNYYSKGGYNTLCSVLLRFKEEGFIKEVNASKYNGLYPTLKTKWTIIKEVETNKWSSKDILKFSDLLNLKYYINRPEYQTNITLKHIISIHNFLRARDNRSLVSCEERCLELFGYEKFLDEEESIILIRLGLTYEDLKMKKYGHMFTYWNSGVADIKTVIILENHSTFFSFKRILKEGGRIFDICPDALIFGEGKKIIKSLSFLEEIAIIDGIRILYFGDIDPEGFMIYRLLKNKYEGMDIKLLFSAYKEMLKIEVPSFKCVGQNKNEENLEFVLKEFKEQKLNYEVDRLVDLWERDKRIPQETISYEYLKRLEGD